jgi:hypothetical protein
VNHLLECDGRGVIVFDEVQKVAPNVLDVFMPALEDRGFFSYSPRLHRNEKSKRENYVVDKISSIYSDIFSAFASSSRKNSATIDEKKQDKNVNNIEEGDDHIIERISTSNAIFIFISDIGQSPIANLMLTYENRSSIPHFLVREKVKKALDDQWSRLEFGKTIREVIPYMPLEREHIEDVLRSKIEIMGEKERLFKWLDLSVDDNLIYHLTGSNFIVYKEYVKMIKPSSKVNSEICDKNDQCAANNSTAALNSSAILKSSKKVFARYGARGIENAG